MGKWEWESKSGKVKVESESWKVKVWGCKEQLIVNSPQQPTASNLHFPPLLTSSLSIASEGVLLLDVLCIWFIWETEKVWKWNWESKIGKVKVGKWKLESESVRMYRAVDSQLPPTAHCVKLALPSSADILFINCFQEKSLHLIFQIYPQPLCIFTPFLPSSISLLAARSNPQGLLSLDRMPPLQGEAINWGEAFLRSGIVGRFLRNVEGGFDPDNEHFGQGQWPRWVVPVFHLFPPLNCQLTCSLLPSFISEHTPM